jgi:hypothetical protein
MDNFKETVYWQARNRSGYWLNKASSTKSGILSTILVLIIAAIALVILHAALFMNPGVTFMIGALVIGFYAIRTIIRDLFEWV